MNVEGLPSDPSHGIANPLDDEIKGSMPLIENDEDQERLEEMNSYCSDNSITEEDLVSIKKTVAPFSHPNSNGALLQDDM